MSLQGGFAGSKSTGIEVESGFRESVMELYQLDYVLHEPREDQGWMYMAEIPGLPGCRAWGEKANEALADAIIRWLSSSSCLIKTGELTCRRDFDGA